MSSLVPNFASDPLFVIALRAIVAGQRTTRHIANRTGMSMAQAWAAVKCLEGHGRVERAGRVFLPRGRPLIRWRPVAARVQSIRERIEAER